EIQAKIMDAYKLLGNNFSDEHIKILAERDGWFLRHLPKEIVNSYDDVMRILNIPMNVKYIGSNKEAKEAILNSYLIHSIVRSDNSDEIIDMLSSVYPSIYGSLDENIKIQMIKEDRNIALHNYVKSINKPGINYFDLAKIPFTYLSEGKIRDLVLSLDKAREYILNSDIPFMQINPKLAKILKEVML
ncbi:MAG: hypothetical protein GX982_05975, partial [Tissierellia bacterium]|nr:hypothetical protein [Tissierellia bacterium]